MSGVFDRLHKKLDLEKREEGISPLEIAELPPNLRKIMRMMLRETQLAYHELNKINTEMPPDARLSQPDLDEALKTLTVQGWLIRRGEGESVTYEVNLRRRAGSRIPAGIWANLEGKIGQNKSEPEEPPQEK